MRPKKAKPAEKDFELLAEQAQQARTQFFVYIATSAFLLVTVWSITDKQLLLNNSSITLPLLNIGVPPLFVLIIGPLLLLLTFSNLHIHWFRYVEEVEVLGLSAEKDRRKLFPIMIYQALYHPKEGFIGVLENSLAELALFWLLVPIQACFLWQILKLQYPVLFLMELVLFASSFALTVFRLQNSTHHSLTFYKWAKDISNKVGLWFRRLKIIDKLLTWYQDPKTSPKLKHLCWRSFWIVMGFGCAAVLIPLSYLKVSYEVLSPPLELINTPIVAPYLERMESKKEVKEAQETHAKHVFEGVYWLDLKGRDLTHANFENTVLLKTNLSGANLTYANLVGTNLEQSNLSSAKLKHANLGRANLQHAYLIEANLQNAYLSWADLQHADLSRANLQHAMLEGVKLQNANLFLTNLQHANFHCETPLICANLQNAFLLRVNLQNAFLSETNLQNAFLSETNLKGVYFETRLDKKTGKEVPDYRVGGETLCEAETLMGAMMDDWLFKKLKTLKACKGKLEGVNDPNYKVSP